MIIGTLNEKSIARKLANAPLPPEAQKAIGALEALATQLDTVATTARAAGDSAGEAAAIKAQDETYAAIDLIQDSRLTESNASSIKGRLIGGSNPGALATTRTKRDGDSSGNGSNASSTYVAGNSPDGGTGPEGGTPPVPTAGGPKPGEVIVVTANIARENTTVGRVVVDALDYTKTKIESFSPLTRELAVGGVRAVLTGGTGPLISVAVNQGAGKALEYVPQSLLRPIAEAGNYINRFIGDGGSSFLLSKDFTGVRTDESTATRRDSNATTFGITTLFGVALGPITVKARELLKGSPKVDVPNGPIQVGDVTSYRDFKKRSVTGDGIEGDHIPSAAALIEAARRKKGGPLTDEEITLIKNEGTVVAVPADVHADSRTFKGRNTREQIKQDAADLLGAACKDAACLADGLKAKGYKQVDINRIIADIKAKLILPPKPPTTPKPSKPSK